MPGRPVATLYGGRFSLLWKLEGSPYRGKHAPKKFHYHFCVVFSQQLHALHCTNTAFPHSTCTALRFHLIPARTWSYLPSIYSSYVSLSKVTGTRVYLEITVTRFMQPMPIPTPPSTKSFLGSNPSDPPTFCNTNFLQRR